MVAPTISDVERRKYVEFVGSSGSGELSATI